MQLYFNGCRENLVDVSPLLSHIKSLPSSAPHGVVEEEEEDMIMKHLSEDGSYFQSPSATAYAYMTTGNLQCLKYLKSVVQRCPNGGQCHIFIQSTHRRICVCIYIY